MERVRTDAHVLSLNSGSSSIKFGLFEVTAPFRVVARGAVDRIGTDESRFVYADAARDRHDRETVGALDHRAAASFVLDWVARRAGSASLCAVGHRIVTGGPRYRQAHRVTAELMTELRRIVAYAPEHLPCEIALIELFAARAPDVPQVACFDTAFHAGMPRVARLFALPRRLQAAGVERYGFHGLSYAFLVEELARLAGRNAAPRRVILAHLGNGTSLAAVRDGVCIDTSMGFTPAAGVPMSTRSGDLDPGLVRYLAHAQNMSADAFDAMVNRESGLLGVSDTSGDVRDLLACEASDERAAEALALFCYHVKKCIGAYAAALGGIDTLVFSGGIGENAPEIRRRVCDGLQFLGVEIDAGRNGAGASVISAGRVTVRVIPTDEEAMIARAVVHVLELAPLPSAIDCKETR